MSDLPVVAKTKREQIWKHLEKGNYSAPEISRLVGTPIENVYKETSLFRKGGGKVVLTKSRKSSVVTSPSGRREISRTEKVRLEVEANDHVSVPPLDADGIKAIYRDFRVGQKTPEIMEKRGLHPEAVEIEERRYLRMSNQDRASLVEKIVNQVVGAAKSDSLDRVKDKYNRTGSLDNTDLVILLNLNNLEQARNGESELLSKISDTSSILPDGWVRPTCCVCRMPIADILVRGNSHAAAELNPVKLSCPEHKYR